MLLKWKLFWYFQVTYKDDVCLEEIEVDLVKDTDKLLKITPNMREVLKAVSKCLVILTWLRENLQGKGK